MRIKGNIEGHWWLPGVAETPVAGILERNDELTLRLYGLRLDPHQLYRVQRDELQILGESLGRPVTAEKAHLVSYNSGTESQFWLSTALVGIHASVDQSDLYEGVGLEVEYLTAWVNHRAFSMRHDHERLNVTYDPQERYVANLPNARVELSGGQSWRKGRFDIAIEHTSALRVEVSTPRSLQDLSDSYIKPLQYFVALATNRYPAICSMSAWRRSGGDPSGLQVVDVYDRGYRKDDREYLSRRSASFTLGDIDFAETLAQWLAIAPKLTSVCQLALTAGSADGTMFLEHWFFNLVTAAEALHNRVFPHSSKLTEEHRARVDRIVEFVGEPDATWLRGALANSHLPSLRQRIHDLLHYVGEKSYVVFTRGAEQWIKDVGNYRNKLAHGRATSPSDAEEILRLSYGLDALVRLSILRLTGFSQEQLAVMARKNETWHR
jgi:hypothetical protein